MKLGLRHYPVVRVGDRFGERVVVQVLPRDHTSNERVRWRCACGREGAGYTFNLRGSLECGSCGQRRRHAERRARWASRWRRRAA